MEWQINERGMIEITCTFDELVTMDSLSQQIWGTPDQNGIAHQFYVGSQKQWRDHFVVADVSDFCEAEGWTDLGWEEMSQDELDHFANDETTVVVPGYKVGA